MGWKDIVKSVAPSIATALGGPLAGAAVSAASNALLGEDEAAKLQGNPNKLKKALENAVLGASPEALLKLKAADHDFETKMAELGVDLENVHAGDRDSARKREMTVGGYAAPVLSGVFCVGFLLLAGYLVWKGLPKDSAPEIHIMIGAIFGGVSAKVDQIISYYFGSSSSSANKNKSIEKAMKGIA